jgi:hypothetical protein
VSEPVAHRTDRGGAVAERVPVELERRSDDLEPIAEAP